MNNYLLTTCTYSPPVVLKQTRARLIPALHKAHGIYPLSVASQLQFRFFARYRVKNTLEAAYLQQTALEFSWKIHVVSAPIRMSRQTMQNGIR